VVFWNADWKTSLSPPSQTTTGNGREQFGRCVGLEGAFPRAGVRSSDRTAVRFRHGVRATPAVMFGEGTTERGMAYAPFRSDEFSRKGPLSGGGRAEARGGGDAARARHLRFSVADGFFFFFSRSNGVLQRDAIGKEFPGPCLPPLLPAWPGGGGGAFLMCDDDWIFHSLVQWSTVPRGGARTPGAGVRQQGRAAAVGCGQPPIFFVFFFLSGSYTLLTLRG